MCTHIYIHTCIHMYTKQEFEVLPPLQPIGRCVIALPGQCYVQRADMCTLQKMNTQGHPYICINVIGPTKTHTDLVHCTHSAALLLTHWTISVCPTYTLD